MSDSPSSVWKLSLMMLAGLIATLGLVWFFVSWELNKTFDRVGHAIILDDLGEYGARYRTGGPEGLRELFLAGEHGRDQMLRLVDPSGQVVFDLLPQGDFPVKWPDLPPLPGVAPGLVDWHRHEWEDGSTLSVGRQKLADGAELWFGRIDVADVDAMSQVHHVILLSMGLASVLAIGPLFWFASRVVRPVRDLVSSVRRVAGSSGAVERVPLSSSIPEIGVLAESFNASMDRIQRLAGELEAANDQLAHELRTPLARIRGIVEKILVSPHDHAVREEAARAIEEIDRATRLVQMILSIRGGEALSLKLALVQLSPGELVASTCELYEAAAEEKNVALVLVPPMDDPDLVCDRERVQQALCNLLDNALAYTPVGGRVEVGTKWEPPYVCLWVRDTGPGLKGEDQDRIWLRFSRGSASAHVPTGIGLGLSLVKAVAHAHGGEAGAFNVPQGGAEFWIRLPASERENP